VAAWEIPPGPSLEEFFQRVKDVQADIDSGEDAEVPDQHVVSRVLLKPFAAPDPKGSGHQLIPHHVKYGPQRPLGLRGCARQAHFLWGASASAEKLWKDEVEDHIGAAVQIVRSGDFHNTSSRFTVEIIKDTIALHYVRSLRWRDVHNAAVPQAMTDVREEILRSKKPLIDAAFRRKFGLQPAGDQARNIVIDKAMADWVKWERSGALSRAHIEFTFRRVRTALRQLSLQVGHTIPECSLLISDSPAVTIQYRENADVKPRMQVALGDADTVVLPLAPDCVVAIGELDRELLLTPQQVDLINVAQTQAAHSYVYYAPGSPLQEFVTSTLRESII
jgi:hypothetical protein